MKPQQQVNIKNKRASFDYELVERFTAGIVLYGTEIKSIREGKASLVDTYCQFSNGELWVRNMQISAYRLGYYYNHDVKRERKLLLNKRELRKLEKATKETGYTIVPTKLFTNEKGLAKLEKATKETGYTIVPTKLFTNEKGFAKLEIALARGKKAYDKRETLKEKEDRRTMDRFLKI